MYMHALRSEKWDLQIPGPRYCLDMASLLKANLGGDLHSESVASSYNLRSYVRDSDPFDIGVSCDLVALTGCNMKTESEGAQAALLKKGG
jgi:hypothetical protein